MKERDSWGTKSSTCLLNKNLIFNIQLDSVKGTAWVTGKLKTWKYSNSSVPHIDNTTCIRCKYPGKCSWRTIYLQLFLRIKIEMIDLRCKNIESSMFRRNQQLALLITNNIPQFTMTVCPMYLVLLSKSRLCLNTY